MKNILFVNTSRHVGEQFVVKSFEAQILNLQSEGKTFDLSLT